MMRFAAEAAALLRRGPRSSSSITRRSSTRRRARRSATAERLGGTCRSTPCACRGSIAHQEVLLGGPGEAADDPPRRDLAGGVRRRRAARAREAPDAAAGRHGRARRAPLTELREETVRVGEVELSLLRPVSPEALIDEEAFARRRVPAVLGGALAGRDALAAALPDGRRAARRRARLRARLPSLVAAARGAEVTATDWAADAVELLRENAAPERARPDAPRCATGASRGPSASTSRSPRMCSTSGATSSRCSSAAASWRPSRYVGARGPTLRGDVPAAVAGPRRGDRRARRSAHAAP